MKEIKRKSNSVKKKKVRPEIHTVKYASYSPLGDQWQKPENYTSQDPLPDVVLLVPPMGDIYLKLERKKEDIRGISDSVKFLGSYSKQEFHLPWD